MRNGITDAAIDLLSEGLDPEFLDIHEFVTENYPELDVEAVNVEANRIITRIYASLDNIAYDLHDGR